MASFQLCFAKYLISFFSITTFYKEYYLINLILLLAKVSIHKCKYGDYKPLFLMLKSEIKHYLKSIYNLINKLLSVFMYANIYMFLFRLNLLVFLHFIVILYIYFLVFTRWLM